MCRWRLHVPRVHVRHQEPARRTFIYRLIGADPGSSRTGAYAACSRSRREHPVPVHPAVGSGMLPLHLNDPATLMTPALAWNTAGQFRHQHQLAGLFANRRRVTWFRWPAWSVQNCVSAAVGTAGRWRRPGAVRALHANDLGKLLVDPVRGTIRILLPISLRRGHPGGRRAIQNFHPARPGRRHPGRRAADHHGRPGRQPGGHQELGTNGGGFANANSAHPFENPTT